MKNQIYIANSNVSKKMADKIFKDFFFANIGHCSMWDDIESAFWREFRTSYALMWLETNGERLEEEFIANYNPNNLVITAMNKSKGNSDSALKWLALQFAEVIGWKKNE